jgi:iron complex transport system substrate-binding protein
LSAVQAGAISELDDDIASRWGPRVVDLLEAIADAVDGQSDA